MTVSQTQLTHAIEQARVRESMGYFELVRAGDQRAASLFARLVAFDLNPTGRLTDYGWLSKSPGESQVDGWAEDAICGNANAADLENVVDLINGAGAPGASIGGSVKQRRENNKWVKPKALSQDEMDYLRSGGLPEQPPNQPPSTPTYPSYEALGGDEGGKKITRQLEADYKRAGKPGLDGDCGAWQQRVSYDFLTGICKTVEESITKHRSEWLTALGLPPV